MLDNGNIISDSKNVTFDKTSFYAVIDYYYYYLLLDSDIFENMIDVSHKESAEI